MKDEEMAEKYKESKRHKCFRADVGKIQIEYEAYLNNLKDGFLAGLKAGRPQWHKLSEKYPEADKLVRVRLLSGMEHICETCYYEPTEDEIGYGKLIINFYELNGEWVDDNEVIAWCEIPTFDKE